MHITIGNTAIAKHKALKNCLEGSITNIVDNAPYSITFVFLLISCNNVLYFKKSLMN